MFPKSNIKNIRMFPKIYQNTSIHLLEKFSDLESANPKEGGGKTYFSIVLINENSYRNKINFI